MHILLTGAAGYTGRGIAGILMARHRVRSLDIRAAENVSELLVGDVTDLDTCRAAVQGADVVVQCHMAPNPAGYETPVQAIDINVKGTANLYHAMVEAGLSRCVLISSTGVLIDNRPAAPGDGPYNFAYNFYVLTKIMQEDIARYYHAMHGISTVLLRPAWIVYDEDFETKYGTRVEHYASGLIDPRDIGRAALAAIDLPEPGLVAFDLGQNDATMDHAPARTQLGWTPEYRFTGLPRE